MYSARVKTCVVGYSIHVFLCFFTPTARELNVLATMQQPSSVVHSKLQYTQHDNTQRNRKKAGTGVCAVQNFGGKLLRACTSGVRGNACNQPVIRMRWERFPRTRFRGWGWLLMCPGMPPAHNLDAAVGWSQLLRPHPGPRQWCGGATADAWHVQQQQRLKSWHFWEPACAPWGGEIKSCWFVPHRRWQGSHGENREQNRNNFNCKYPILLCSILFCYWS